MIFAFGIEAGASQREVLQAPVPKSARISRKIRIAPKINYWIFREQKNISEP